LDLQIRRRQSNPFNELERVRDVAYAAQRSPDGLRLCNLHLPGQTSAESSRVPRNDLGPCVHASHFLRNQYEPSALQRREHVILSKSNGGRSISPIHFRRNGNLRCSRICERSKEWCQRFG